MTDNIVHDLTVEMERIERLLAGPMDYDLRREARDLLRFGRERMLMNDHRGMLEALTSLREFGKRKKGQNA